MYYCYEIRTDCLELSQQESACLLRIPVSPNSYKGGFNYNKNNWKLFLTVIRQITTVARNSTEALNNYLGIWLHM